jgi:hypothetical protein
VDTSLPGHEIILSQQPGLGANFSAGDADHKPYNFFTGSDDVLLS